MKRNKVVVLSCCLALIFFFGTVSLAAATEAEPQVGQMVGNVTFTGTITPEGSTYLGLAKQGPFTLEGCQSALMCWWSSSIPVARIACTRLPS